MVNPACTATSFNDRVEVDDEDAIDSAASAWALLATADDALSSPETREALGRAREAFQSRLAVLGWSEDDLLTHLKRLHRISGNETARCGVPPDKY